MTLQRTTQNRSGRPWFSPQACCSAQPPATGLPRSSRRGGAGELDVRQQLLPLRVQQLDRGPMPARLLTRDTAIRRNGRRSAAWRTTGSRDAPGRVRFPKVLAQSGRAAPGHSCTSHLASGSFACGLVRMDRLQVPTRSRSLPSGGSSPGSSHVCGTTSHGPSRRGICLCRDDDEWSAVAGCRRRPSSRAPRRRGSVPAALATSWPSHRRQRRLGRRGAEVIRVPKRRRALILFLFL